MSNLGINTNLYVKERDRLFFLRLIPHFRSIVNPVVHLLHNLHLVFVF